ncbi:hypothetical protein [Rubritalea profundi]|uniref:hypothetical protein n=1 Tax=Rubritalea profundi TaxID=1658618 RepID=UPI0013FD2F5B|nr:hypothetical protein [Rubritalea profundi]
MPFSRSLNPRRDHNVTLLNNEVINDAVLNAEFFSKISLNRGWTTFKKVKR